MKIMRIPLSKEIVFLTLMLYLWFPVDAHRNTRALIYPKGATYKFNIGMGFPIDLPQKILSFSMNFQFQYVEPTNVTILKEFPELRRSLRQTVDRRSSYLALQNVMDRYGLEGKSCLLRSICEIAETPVYYNGLIGEILHAIFTPGYGMNTEEYVERDYHEARRLGEEGADCRLTFRKCPFGEGLLDLISVLDT